MNRVLLNKLSMTAAGCAMLAAGTLMAAPVNVINADFTGGYDGTSVMEGWTNVVNNTYNYGSIRRGWYANFSTYTAYICSGGNYVYQNVGTLLANTEYTLTAMAHVRQSSNGSPVGITLALANGATLDTALASTSDAATAWTLGKDYSVSFTTGADVSGDLVIILANSSTGLNNAVREVEFWNVRLDAVTIPEPAALGLLSLGSLLLLRRR